MPKIEIQQLVETAITVSPDTLIRELKKCINGGEALRAAVVLEGERPLGLIMSHHLDRALSHRYGVSLYHNRSVAHIMDARPLLVPAAASLEAVAAKAMDRLPNRVYDHILVVDKGCYLGIVTVRRLLTTVAAQYRDTTNNYARINTRLNEEIQERRSAEAALQRSRRMLQLVIDSIPQSIYWKGADSIYLGCNQNFLDDLGKTSRDAVIQHSDQEIRAQADEARFTSEEDKRVMQNGIAEYHKVTPTRLANGEKAYLDISRIPLQNEKGVVVGLLGTYENITAKIAAKEERKALEAQVRRSEKMEAIGTLAGGVAHDLNNILSGLVSYPDLLLMDLAKDSPMRVSIEKIKRSGQRAAAIVQDLLTLSRRGVDNKAPLRLTTLVAEYLRSPELQELMAASPSVRLHHDLGDGVLPVVGTGFQLEKVIMNLVSNAVEAIQEAGEVAIGLTSCYLDRSHFGFEEIPPGDYTRLDVRDTGKGIAADDLGRIFEPFYTKKVMGRSGTGLGLAVVWGIVKDHEGYVDVISRTGEGTCFQLYLPAHRSPLETQPEQVAFEAYRGNGETVLIVDDMPEQREIAGIMLAKLGYRALAVASGEEALDHQRREPADLLLLDMIMEPGIDGLETFQQARRLNPRQRAIIASGFSESERVKAALELGAGAYIRKPYSLESIGIAIRRELDRSHLPA